MGCVAGSGACTDDLFGWQESLLCDGDGERGESPKWREEYVRLASVSAPGSCNRNP
jgi:hypothetical protein